MTPNTLVPMNVFTARAVHHTVKFGDFDIYVTKRIHDNVEHIVLVRGALTAGESVLCRVASSCVTSTALNSADCDCRQQMDTSLEIIARENRGVIIYLSQEGRGHGIANKVRALANKNRGFDTLSAVEELGLPVDVRRYDIVPVVLSALNVSAVRLLTNNPEKRKDIEKCGVRVEGIIPLPRTDLSAEAQRNIEAKQLRGFYVVS